MTRCSLKNTLCANWDGALLGLIIFIYMLMQQPIVGPDSLTYLNFHPMRPPLYPIFLWLFQGLGQLQLITVIWAQALLGYAALLYAQHWLNRRLHLPRTIIFFILLFTLLLIFCHYNTLSTVASEGLTVPLFIFFFLTLSECFADFNLIKIIRLSIYANLLILTRAQFYYLYLLLIILAAWYFWKKVSLTKVLMSLMAMIAIAAITLLINRGYHYEAHGQFAEVPVIGEQLIVQSLYLADANTANDFTEPSEKQLIQQILKQLAQQQIMRNSAPAIMVPPTVALSIAYYTTAYNPILAVIDQTFADKPIFQKDKILLHLSKILYQNNIQKNGLFYLERVSAFFGDLAFFVVFLFVFGTQLFYLVRSRASQSSMTQIFSVLALCTILLNTSFVAIFEPLLPCYSFYAYFLIFCLGGMLAKNIFNKASASCAA